jgi:hypothetical protein
MLMARATTEKGRKGQHIYRRHAKDRHKFAQRMSEWSAEVEESADRFGRRIENRFDEEFLGSERFRKLFHDRAARIRVHSCGLERPCSGNRMFSTIGFLAPLIGSIFGTAMLALFAWLLPIFDFGQQAGFFHAISGFFLSNIAMFFVAALFFEFAKYLGFLYPRSFRVIWPIVDAAGAAWAAWIMAYLLPIVNLYWPAPALVSASAFLYTNLVAIFLFFLVLGYIFLPFRRRCSCDFEQR